MCHTELVRYKQCQHAVREFHLCPSQNPKYAWEKTIYLEPCGMSVLNDDSRDGQCPRCATVPAPSSTDTDVTHWSSFVDCGDEIKVPPVEVQFKEVDYEGPSAGKDEMLSPLSWDTKYYPKNGPDTLNEAIQKTADDLIKEVTASKESNRPNGGVTPWARPSWDDSLRRSSVASLKQDLSWKPYALPTFPELFGRSGQLKLRQISEPFGGQDTFYQVRPVMPAPTEGTYCKHGTKRLLNRAGDNRQKQLCTFHIHPAENPLKQSERDRQRCD